MDKDISMKQFFGNLAFAVVAFILIAIVAVHFKGQAFDFGFFQVTVNFNPVVLAELLVSTILVSFIVRIFAIHAGFSFSIQISSQLFQTVQNLTELLISFLTRTTTPPPKAA